MTRTFQQILFTPQTEWVVPEELKDLRGHKEIAVDLETCDPELMELGSGNVIGRGKIVGCCCGSVVERCGTWWNVVIRWNAWWDTHRRLFSLVFPVHALTVNSW